jgi:hypothetical protein
MLTKIKTQDDINYLMEKYCGFHDSCIVKIRYESGLRVDDENSMHFPEEEGHNMIVVFQSQIVRGHLELHFKGVRRFYLSARTENYLNEIFDAHISFFSEKINGEDKNLIIWADCSDFDLEKINIDLSKPEASFILADELSYRK